MKRRGFTVVELMVVICILAILVGISVFAFGSWRTRTSNTQISHEIASANNALRNYANFNNAFPATGSIASLYQADPKLTTTYTLRADGKSYCLKIDDGTGANIATQYYDSATGQTTTTVCS